MKPRILISNSYSGNVGDLAILQAMVDQLSPISKSITVHSSNPQVSSRFCPGAACRDFVVSYERKPGIRIINKLKRLHLYSMMLLSGLLKKNLTARPQLDDFLNCDIMLSSGGGFLSSDYPLMHAYLEILLSKLAGKRVVIYAQSVGPYNGIGSSLFPSFVLRMADLIILREKKSKRILHKMGIRKVYVTADAAFAIPPPPKTRRRREVILCPRKPLGRFRGSEENYMQFLSELAKALLRRGWKVTLLPTTKHDIDYHALLDMPDEVEFIDRLLSPDLAARLISRAEFLVSSRMHPIILGSLTGTPFVAMGWEFKLEELSRSLGAGSIPAHKLDQRARNFILKEIDERQTLSEDVEYNVLNLRKKAIVNPEILAAYLPVWGFER